ncbi:hypothetical protein DAI22_02g367500 [Oryza sativa Japonica Group]|nr:hypothetical protein DAI22_02g367500 [Oryza sativa Japonica Group]
MVLIPSSFSFSLFFYLSLGALFVPVESHSFQSLLWITSLSLQVYSMEDYMNSRLFFFQLLTIHFLSSLQFLLLHVYKIERCYPLIHTIIKETVDREAMLYI